MIFFAILLVLRNKSSETTTIEISSDIGTKWGVTVTNSMSAIKHRGPRLNIKTVLSTYGDFHVKDNTAVRTSYL